MEICKWFAPVTIIVLLPVLHAEAHCPGNAAGLRFRLGQRSEIVVPVSINRAGPYDFLLDTGAQMTAVDPALADALHLKIQGATEVVGVGSRMRAGYAQLDLLAVSSQVIASPLVFVENLHPLLAADPYIQGILGGNVLEHFDLLIDYAHNMLCLDNRKVMQSKLKGERIALGTPPHTGEHVLPTEPLILTVRLYGVTSQQLRLLLDSGANMPYLFHPEKHVALAFTGRTQFSDRGADGRKQAFPYLQPQDMQVGTLAFHQISFITRADTVLDIPEIDIDGLLPTRFFRKIYISYSDRFVVLDSW
jgi:hypothetical protein